MGNCPCLRHAERQGISDEQRERVVGQAGEMGGGHGPDPRSTGRTSITHMRRCPGGLEIQNMAACAPHASGASL